MDATLFIAMFPLHSVCTNTAQLCMDMKALNSIDKNDCKYFSTKFNMNAVETIQNGKHRY